MNEIVTHLKGDKSDLERELKGGTDLAEQFGDKVTDIFQKVGAAIAAYFTITTIKNFFQEAIAEAMEAESALTKLNAMIKVTGGSAGVTAEQIQKLGTQIQLTTRHTDDSVVAAAALLMRYKSLQGEGLERTIKLSADLATLMGGDLRSSAQMLGRALESPEHASRMLRMAGIALTDQQEKQIKTFVELGEKAKAQEILFGLLEDRLGGLSTEMTDLETKNAKLNNQLGEVKETIGGAILPVLHELVEVLEDSADAYTVLGEEAAKALTELFAGGTEIDGVNESLVELVANLTDAKQAWQNLAGGLAEKAGEFQTSMEEWRAKFWQDLAEGENKANPLQHFFQRMADDAKARLDEVRQQQKFLMEDNDRGAEQHERHKDDVRERMRAKRQEREAANAPQEVNPDADADAAMAAADAAFDAEMEARGRRDVVTHGPRNRMKRGDQAGFGAGKDGKDEDDVFQSQIEGVEELHRRVSASAASSSPAKKIEDAVIKAGKEQAIAIERVEAVLKPVSEHIREQLDIMKQPDERFSTAVLG